MIVAELMHKNVVSVLPETSLADTVRMMLAQRVSGLPVVDKSGRLVGVVTEGDLLRRAELGTEGKRVSWLKSFFMPGRMAEDYVATHGRRVSEVMTAEPIFVSPETELTEVADIMLSKRIKRLPVLDNGALVGVISRSDLLRTLALKLIETSKGDVTDQAIGEHIKAALAHERWAPQSGIRVTVKGRAVELEGSIFSDAERRAVNVIVENAPGVKEVHDNMVFVDPGSGMSFPGPL